MESQRFFFCYFAVFNQIVVPKNVIKCTRATIKKKLPFGFYIIDLEVFPIPFYVGVSS